MDKLRKIIKYDKQMMIALSILVILGVVTGSVFTLILNSNDKNYIIESIKKFNNNIISGQYNIIDSFKNVLVSNVFMILLIWILGISIIGIIVVITYLFWKSFTLGFTISSFIITFQFKGLLLSFFYLFPQLVLNVLIFMYLSSYSVQLSLIMIKSIIGKKALNFRVFMHNYTKILLISLVGIVVSGLYEVFVNPYILKFISSLLLK